MLNLRPCVWIAVLSAAALGARTPDADYVLILRDAPVARQIHGRAELHSPAARRQSRAIAAAQDRLTRELARRKVRVTGSAHVLLNAVFVRVPPKRVPELGAMPGVQSIQPVARLHRHLDQAVQLMGMPDAWNAAGGVANAGAGVKIGILDTGIDQTHAAFQDSSLSPPDGFPKGDPNYTNNKVIVARSYVQTLALGNGTPQDTRPDDLSPRDRSGHGTAVAMIAAGEPNQGPLATITGIAPKAWLGSYKVFGSPGVNDFTNEAVVVPALEDAFNDGMDIVVLPFGEQPVYPAFAQDCGGVCYQRDFAIEQAVQNAIQLGMTVVVSAGNDGPFLNSVNTPGLVPAAITVGASTNTHALFANVQAGGNSFNAIFGDAPPPAQPITAPLRDVSQLGTDAYACSALPGGSLAGAVALIARGNCDYSQKIDNAQNAGAAGAIVYQASGNNTPVSMLGRVNTGIPAVMIGNADGTALQALVQATPDAPATIDPTLQTASQQPNLIASYSSRGPTIGDASIKPDLVAVGDGIYTATESSDSNGDLYSATGYTGVSGTTFAAAMVAGAAALVKQANPSLTPGQIKSALVNTATQDVADSSGSAHVTAMGAGKLNASAALGSNVAVEPATISFGTGTGPVNLTITNTGSSPANLSMNVPDARMSLSQTNLALNPGQSSQVAVRLSSRPGPGSYDGLLTITGGSANLNVPYLYLVGDGTPAGIFPIANGSFTDVVSGAGWLLAFKLIDQYGAPVTNYPVFFHVVSGGGSIAQGDASTDKTGIAGAIVNLGAQPGPQVFTATAGPLTVEFDGFARASAPLISSINDASTGQGALTPGSAAVINGSFLSDASKSVDPGSPALQLAGVSVSFDAPGVSVPGLLTSVAPGQINLQVPAQLAGQSSAQVKVSIGGLSSSVVSVPLAVNSSSGKLPQPRSQKNTGNAVAPGF